MKLLILGHRGAGKSHFLKRMQLSSAAPPDMSFFCLDEAIEARAGKSIGRIFADEGEQKFRQLEMETFAKLYASQQKFAISLGAGFEGSIPADCQVLWLQRKVDLSQALFLDRPNIGGQIHFPKDKFIRRAERFRRLADLEIVLEEHLQSEEPGEEQLFAALLAGRGLAWPCFYFTPETTEQWQGVRRIYRGAMEFRNDLIPPKAICELADPDRDLLSFRDPGKTAETRAILSDFRLWDWALELGPCEFALPPILSSHSRKDHLAQSLMALPKDYKTFKLAIPIRSWEELIDGHAWWQEDPANRIFMPMSDDGRWQWYRQIQAHRYAINFFRTGESGVLDQPTLLQLAQWQSEAKGFAAVLGQPVRHSLTPSFHRQYFFELSMNVVAIALAEAELFAALPFLQSLGLRCAAVTSPLKNSAGELTHSTAPVNTLAWDEGEKAWQSTNTDEQGLKVAAAPYSQTEVAVWGGGGTSKVIGEVFPRASFYSSRTGELKQGAGGAPQGIVWAVGRSAFDEMGRMPPPEWRPQFVFDLNYTLDSPGIACAANFGCQYINGLTMFKEQALGQQRFWSQYVRK